MLKNKDKGIVTELQCIVAFNQLGCHVSVPYGENSRYDMIVDIEGFLIKVQTKTASLSKDGGSIKFKCESTYTDGHVVKTRKYNKSEIDYFCTYYNNQCYLVPVEECGSYKYLRFSAAKNNQTKGINLASDYELEKQIDKIIEELNAL